ncbi:hypothetical protein B0H14DRAFT_3722557 [Mycena olivaceomarginata]|nr:hypothetical protein B0H14DRAFT_3722557 [Mycena olivaceomarginata]
MDRRRSADLYHISVEQKLGMNIFRLIRGYVDFRLALGGPVGYLGSLKSWDHILKDTVFGAQSMIADTAAVYRCWMLYDRKYTVIIFSSILLFIGTVSGYVVCSFYTTADPNATVFDPRLMNWITTFWSVGVAQNIITTDVMAPVEVGAKPAALNLFVQILLLAFYSVNYNVQCIILECITPHRHEALQGFTFSIMTIRINLRSQKKAANALSPFGGTGGSTPPMTFTQGGTKFEDEP